MKSLKQLGRALGLGAALGAAILSQAAPALAEVFTIAVVSDTQNYSDITLAQPRGEETYAQQMRYLVETKADKNLAFVTFVGDIVQHGDGQFRRWIPDGDGRYDHLDTREEWDIANRSISILAESGTPFGMVLGNHDYDN